MAVLMEVCELVKTTLELQEPEERAEHKRETKCDEKRDEDEHMSEPTCEYILSVNQTPSKTTRWENSSDPLNLIKKAVVVLTRLPEYKISALRPPTPQQFYSEDESLSSSDSDMQWETEDDSSDSNLSDHKQKSAKTTVCDTTKTPESPTTSNNGSAAETAPVTVSSAFAHCSRETTNARPNLPEGEVEVDMMVLARKRPMKWQRGKVVEVVTKEDGQLKYKVSFKEKGKCLVSGHHIAFDNTPKLEQLYVGARVVVRCLENKYLFRPGVLAELPNRKNRLRFLVFMDDHTPVYVGLPLLHLVCRPLEDVLDDIPEGSHKSFLKQYLMEWPETPAMHCRAGQNMNVELNGVHQRCEVQVVDSKLIRVIFQEDQHKEWIYRGSFRLEHMARVREWPEMRQFAL